MKSRLLPLALFLLLCHPLSAQYIDVASDIKPFKLKLRQEGQFTALLTQGLSGEKMDTLCQYSGADMDIDPLFYYSGFDGENLVVCYLQGGTKIVYEADRWTGMRWEPIIRKEIVVFDFGYPPPKVEFMTNTIARVDLSMGVQEFYYFDLKNKTFRKEIKPR